MHYEYTSSLQNVVQAPYQGLGLLAECRKRVVEEFDPSGPFALNAEIVAQEEAPPTSSGGAK